MTQSNTGSDLVADLQRQFRELQFGLFVHFNMLTYFGGEWVKGYVDPANFSPGGKVDTDAWADAAVSAGMKYGVLTTKHVSGFCLWDSDMTEYCVAHPDCPYEHDLVAQFVESFTSRGLKVGLYYCWRNPGFDDKEPGVHKVLPPECDPAENSLAEQNEFQKRHVTELVEKFPDVFFIFNDALGERCMPAEEAKVFARGLPREIISCGNWWDWKLKGQPYLDLALKEQRDFPEDNTLPGETCWALEESWFWDEGTKLADIENILEHKATAHARNSNFLLNVGPDKQGNIIPESIEALARIGQRLNH